MTLIFAVGTEPKVKLFEKPRGKLVLVAGRGRVQFPRRYLATLAGALSTLAVADARARSPLILPPSAREDAPL